MAFIGNGAQLTDLDAGDIASGTLPIARGGTGTSSPSLVGGTNITISGSWPNQTVTAAGGGVTSLNGQTGAITNTNLDSIGSYIIALTANNAPGPLGDIIYTVNTTIAGSSLRYNWNFSSAIWAQGFSVLQVGCSSGSSNSYSGGGSSLSGTWRLLSRAGQSAGPTNIYGEYTRSWAPGLWVRIS